MKQDNTALFYNSKEEAVPLKSFYKDATAFLILNGPSLKDVDLSQINRTGALSVGVNNGPREFQPNIWISADRPRKFLPSTWKNPQILKFVRKRHFRQAIWDLDKKQDSETLARECPGVFWYQVTRKFNAETFLSRPFAQLGPPQAKSTMLAAIRILYELGVTRIYLLGCDFNMKAEQPYFFKERVSEASLKHNNKAYQRLAQLLHELQPSFLANGLRIYNCNPNSGLKAFPFCDVNNVFNDLGREMQQLKEVESCTNLYIKD